MSVSEDEPAPRKHNTGRFLPTDEMSQHLRKGKPGAKLGGGPELAESNVGHQLLKKMGWKEGELECRFWLLRSISMQASNHVPCLVSL